MNCNCGNIAYRFHIPDFPEKLFLRKNSVWILGQECEQIKFLGGKSFLLAIYPDAAGSLVYLDSTNLNNIVLLRGGADQTVIAIHMCLYSGNKLAWAKWLGHVIVSPKSKTADLVNIIFLRGNHNDRSILSFSYLAADFKPVYLRQHQIQNNQVKIFFQCHIKPQIASVADYNFKS